MRPLNVVVVGGGPVGLIFATELKLQLGVNARIVIYESRCLKRGGRIVRRGPAEGNRRREQVVTLQSRVFDQLSPELQAALFIRNGFAVVWPYGPDSLASIGRPRNIRISDVENRLLELAQEMKIRIVPKRFSVGDIDRYSIDLLAICDGAQSATRDHFTGHFGIGDATPYAIDGQQLVDVVLGLRVKSSMSAAAGVVMTIAQNRFLLNSLNGEGFLNLRLTSAEASEVRGVSVEGRTYSDCIQASPCTMVRESGNRFVCPTHGTLFAPAVDPTSFLWPRILEGLKLFDVKLEDLTSITSFRLAMVQRGRFTSEITSTDTHATFGALVGDAANAIHFWAGRGLNHGILSAISFVRALSSWSGETLRSADFTHHEAAMAALQHRHKTRAWYQMVTRRGERVIPIRDLFADAILGTQPRAKLLAEMKARIRDIGARLADRLEAQPNMEELDKLLSSVDDETLRILAHGSGWETRRSAGEEVDLDALNPRPSRRQ